MERRCTWCRRKATGPPRGPCRDADGRNQDFGILGPYGLVRVDDVPVVGQLVEHTPVQGFETDADGEIKAVDTSRGTITCDYVVNAAGAWSPMVFSGLGISVPVSVEPEASRRGLEIRVLHGAQLRVHYEGPAPSASFTIEQDGVLVAADNLPAGALAICPILPGPAVVRLEGACRPREGENRDRVPFARERTVEVGEGESSEVRFVIEE